VTDLVYALIQIAHNLGAVALIGLPVAAWVREGYTLVPSRALLLSAAVAWGVQALSGAGFAVASLKLKGALPEVEGVALAALVVKIAATVVGFALAALALWRSPRWSSKGRRRGYAALVVCALVPMAAAAILRWYL
jgi:hypothetical protein